MQRETAKTPRPFWHQINTFFAFPLQPKPLMYSVLLALSSLLFKLIFFVPDALGILIVEIGILLAASRYGFKVTALGSRGIYKAGGLYAPGVADTTPDYVPDVDCIAEPMVTNEPPSRVGNRSPYSVLGKKYDVMQRVDGYVEQGTASYYGNKFHGRRTSNQEVYDMYAYSAAHKSLPLPSFARVTNLDNGKSVVVRVNDRGPFHEGRVIDLSYAAAVRLGITQRGTGRVEVRALTPDGNTLAAAPSPSSSAMDQLVGQLPKDAARYHASAKPGDVPSAAGFDAWIGSPGLRHAHDVIVNDRDLAWLHSEVDRLHHFYLTLRGGQA